MPRPHRNDIEAKALGKALTRLHNRSGQPTHQHIYDVILQEYGHSMGSVEQVRKMHRGEVDPTTTSIEDLVALRRFYGAAELTPAVTRRERLVLALAGLTGPDGPGGLGISLSPCRADILPFRKMGRPSTHILVDRILDGGLSDYLANARTAGHSFERIAKMLYEEHAIDVTGETVRRWHDTITAEQAQAAS